MPDSPVPLTGELKLPVQQVLFRVLTFSIRQSCQLVYDEYLWRAALRCGRGLSRLNAAERGILGHAFLLAEIALTCHKTGSRNAGKPSFIGDIHDGIQTSSQTQSQDLIRQPGVVVKLTATFGCEAFKLRSARGEARHGVMLGTLLF